MPVSLMCSFVKRLSKSDVPQSQNEMTPSSEADYFINPLIPRGKPWVIQSFQTFDYMD